jgi:hypothetical protein
MWFVKVKRCKSNIQPPLLLSEWISTTLYLKKVQRRRGDRYDDEHWWGAKQRTTPRTRDRGEPEREEVPQLDPHMCRRDGSEEGDDDEHHRGSNWQWSEPNAGDEGPRLDPLRIPTRGQADARRCVPARGQRSGRGACLMFASTSVWQLRRGVEGAAKKV